MPENITTLRKPRRHGLPAVRILAACAALGACAALAQELSWKNPGNFDYSGHQGRTPGDPDIPSGTPPGFDAGIAHPTALKVQVTGMGFLSDGRMALAHWGGFGKNGMMYVMQGMSGDKEAIKATQVAQGLWEPFGVKVLNDEIYYTAQDGLWKLSPKAGTPGAWEIKPVAKFIIPIKAVGVDFPIAFNTAYSNGSFYYSTGAYKNFNPKGQNEGYVVRFELATGAQEIMARGIRMPNGMAANAAGDVFYADNQGEYRPSSAIFHVVKGRHFGMAAPNGRDGNLGGAMTNMLPLPPADSITPPAVHIPYRPGSASLTNMFHLEHTAFAGQFLVGDNAYGGVHRVQVEKVKGEYQGAVFQFSGVLEGGIQSFTAGPDGAIYGGTSGMGSNGWSWLGRETGLMKWKPNSQPVNSMISVMSQREGFDVRFSEPLGAMAANPELWWVNSYTYTPTSSYGGPRQDMKRMRVTQIRTSLDRRTVALTVEGLQAGRVYRIMLSPDLKTAAGQGLWTRNAWYTLNRISDAAPLNTGTSSIASRGGKPPQAEFLAGTGSPRLRIHDAGPYSIRIVDIKGNRLAALQGIGPATRDLGPSGAGPAADGTAGFAGAGSRAFGPGLRILQLTTPRGTLSRLLDGSGHAP